MRYKWSVLCCMLFCIACNSNYVQKPKGYAKIDFPEKIYIPFNQPNFHYSFEIPTYALLDEKPTYLGKEKQNEGWLNIRFPVFNATLYLTYSSIPGKQPKIIDTLVRDAYVFANNHNSKASFIEDSAFEETKFNKGVFFHIGGDVATSYQFFITDSVHHFVRAALYFDASPNEDSLAPVNQFIFQDMKQMVRTWRWK